MLAYAGVRMLTHNLPLLKQRRARAVDAGACAGMLYVWGGNMCKQVCMPC